METRIGFSNTTLTETLLFKLFFWSPVVISILIAIAIYFFNKEQITLSLNISALDNLYSHFKLPLLILGSSIPLTALAASVHRSEQTQAQLTQQMLQNQFSNHFKHIEEFKKQYNEKDIQLIKTLWGSVEAMHGAFYPNTHIGIYKSTVNITKIENTLSDFIETYVNRYNDFIVANTLKFEKLITDELKIKNKPENELVLFSPDLYFIVNNAQSFSGNYKSKTIEQALLSHSLTQAGSMGIFFKSAYKIMKEHDPDLKTFKAEWDRGSQECLGLSYLYNFHIIKSSGLLNLQDSRERNSVVTCLQNAKNVQYICHKNGSTIFKAI
ncbi:hypothetical protein Q4490_09855 [Neptunomonas phycophila]|uniref:Uncharacterized protein n=1 Tax=Neptunomonas phycophila TaxID=1572645 RepID=A0AAW7XM27_9GAMM|nr:hypothetical protein [Neptunomonas phycophila]MDO6453870.1 hypothetical protein [Neptunomonas phycophila]